METYVDKSGNTWKLEIGPANVDSCYAFLQGKNFAVHADTRELLITRIEKYASDNAPKSELARWLESNNRRPLKIGASIFAVVVGGLVVYGWLSPKQRILRAEMKRDEDRALRSVGLDPDAVRIVRRFQ